MAIQIRGNQIQSATIEPAKLDLTATYDFSSGTLQAATPSANNDVATKAYVDAALPDSFSGGNGIAIDTSGDPDVISVDLATNPGMQFTAGKLDLYLDGSTLSKGAAGLKVADGGIASNQLLQTGGSEAVVTQAIRNNAIVADKIASDAVVTAKIQDGAVTNVKLANSTISGKALGANLDSLSAGQGISMTSYNGSAAVSDLTVQLDGSTLFKSAGGIKIADGGVGTSQLAGTSVTSDKIQDGAVGNAKIADGAVSAAKCQFEGAVDFFNPDGSTSSFALSQEVPSDFFGMVLAYKNGLLMKGVASSPADADEYSVSTTTGVTSVVFGGNLSSSDTLQVRSFGIKAP